MRGLLMVTVILAVLLLNMSAAGQETGRPKDFGKRWVRSHPFTLMALTLTPETFDPKQYRSAGLNLVRGRKSGGYRDAIFRRTSRAGLPWHFYIMRKRKGQSKASDLSLTDKEKAEAHRLYNNFPGCTGWELWGEPRRRAFKTIAPAMDWFRRTFPDMLVYSALYSAGANPGKYYDSPKDPKTGKYVKPPIPYTHKEYLQEYVTVCRPDVLLTTIYPFIDVEICDAESWISARFFLSLANYRRQGLKTGIPYWTCVQVFAIPNSKYYYPSESDVRMQVFSSLAYGFTGLSYFLYQSPIWPQGLLDGDGLETPIFRSVTRLNKEVASLGRALRFLTSTDVRFAPGRHYCPRPIPNGEYIANLLPEGARAFEPSAGAAYGITDFRAHGIDSTRNGLIGFFRDDDGGKYIMAVNLRRCRGVSADEMKARVTVTFEPSVKSVWRLPRTTGQVEEVPITGGTLELTLPGGTGDLFKLGDGKFPGLGNPKS